MRPKKTYKYPLTFEKIREFEIRTTEGRKLYVRSNLYSTSKYFSTCFYKPICDLI